MHSCKTATQKKEVYRRLGEKPPEYQVFMSICSSAKIRLIYLQKVFAYPLLLRSETQYKYQDCWVPRGKTALWKISFMTWAKPVYKALKPLRIPAYPATWINAGDAEALPAARRMKNTSSNPKTTRIARLRRKLARKIPPVNRAQMLR